jgi:cob(I)alamin adenosyltransferase
MSKYFTRKGDDGTTGLLGEGRVQKFDLRMEVLGVLDEASAALGLARSFLKSEQTGELVIEVQRDLYQLMAEVAATPETEQRFRVIDETKVKWIESTTNEIGQKIEMPDQFIVSGDSQSSAAISLARTIIRRAERRLVELFRADQFHNEHALAYINRLSSLCFVLELHEIQGGENQNPTLAKGS